MSHAAACESQIYARLGRPGRIWAVASIHGEAARLKSLHRALGARFHPDDRVVYLGNYLGRGPAIGEAIAELLAFRCAVLARGGGFACDVAFLRGSQEEMWQKLLQLQFAPNPREVLQWMVDHGIEPTIATYGGDANRGFAACREGPLAITRWTSALRAAVNAAPGHGQLMAALRRAAFTEEGSLLFVHAGIDAGKPLDLQGDVFWWGGGHFIELAEPYGGYARVVRGFDRRHGGLVEAPHAVSLDAGCGFGGPLIAACFERDGTVVDRIEV